MITNRPDSATADLFNSVFDELRATRADISNLRNELVPALAELMGAVNTLTTHVTQSFQSSG